MIACVPGGGHAPTAEDFGDPEDISIWRTVVREFLEEFFDKEDFALALTGGKRFGDLISDPISRECYDAFFGNGGAAKIYLLGVGLDPVSIKPDILMAVVIDWLKASTMIGYLSKRQENFEGRSVFINFTSEREFREYALRERPLAEKQLYPATKALLLLVAERHLDFLMSET